MTTVGLVVLAFMIYRADAPEDAPLDTTEQGAVIARSCAEAETWVRRGLRPGQSVWIGECRPAAAAVAEGGR